MKKQIITYFYPSVLFFLLFLIPFSSHGQSYRSFRSELEQINKRTKWRIGPLRIYLMIRFKNIGYDDNVYYQREEDEPASDFTGTTSFEIKAHLLFRNHIILTLTENPEYVYYYEQRRERRWNNTLSPEIKILFLNRFVISGRYSYINGRRQASSEFDVLANEIIEGYSGSFFYETARRTSLGFSGSIRKIRYEDITLPGEEIYLSRALNREERNGGFEFYYRIFSKSYFFVRGGYTEYRFEHTDAGWRDSYSSQAYSGIRFPILGRVRGTLSLGYKKLFPREKGKKGYSGFVGNTTLNFRLSRFGIRLNYDRDCYFSYWTNNIYFINDRYAAGMSFYLSRFLKIDYNYTYGESNYPEMILLKLSDGSYEEIKRKDIYRNRSIGFVFRIVNNTGVGLMVNFWQQESNIQWANKERMFVGGYITHEF